MVVATESRVSATEVTRKRADPTARALPWAGVAPCHLIFAFECPPAAIDSGPRHRAPGASVVVSDSVPCAIGPGGRSPVILHPPICALTFILVDFGFGLSPTGGLNVTCPPACNRHARPARPRRSRAQRPRR